MQGLLNRPDWETSRRVPLAHVPGGSGNGLAASCGLWDTVTAAYSICKGRTQPLDVASVLQPPLRPAGGCGAQQAGLAAVRGEMPPGGAVPPVPLPSAGDGGGGKRYYSFLSVVFGLWANMDIGTEGSRWAGDSRFTLRAVQEALMARPYPARIAFWPASQPCGPGVSAHRDNSAWREGGMRCEGAAGRGAAAFNGVVVSQPDCLVLRLFLCVAGCRIRNAIAANLPAGGPPAPGCTPVLLRATACGFNDGGS